MGGFLFRRLVFGFAALFVGLTASFFFFASQYAPLHSPPPSHSAPLLHDYWVWLRGLPSGRSLSHGLLADHLLSSVGAAFGRTLLLLALTFVIVLVVSLPLACLAAAKRGDGVADALRSNERR